MGDQFQAGCSSRRDEQQAWPPTAAKKTGCRPPRRNGARARWARGTPLSG